MGFFLVIGCSWLVVALMMLWSHHRGEDPTTGQWRALPSTFFGGPDTETKAADDTPSSIAAGGPVPG